MRLFLAIELPKKIKQQITESLKKIQLEYQDYHWVETDNFHLTLVFIGERKEYQSIAKKIKDALYDQEKFYLYSQKVDLFMNSKIVIYLGFNREKKLENLVEKIKKSLNFVSEKKFIPHLTLARCRIPSKQQYFHLRKKLNKLNIEIEFPVKKVVLYQSILATGRPVYKKLDQFPLIDIK
ncbi:MAG: RNA 2',3'-cyclic phosphodiesterase [Microgenomates group bacterium]|nr:RNA 2',3'-cyclic phosphodiesterase [Microgenomates group bacterium]